MSLLSSIGKGLLGGVVGLATGGPVGAFRGATAGFMGGTQAPPSPPSTIFGVGAGAQVGGYTIGGGINIGGSGGVTGFGAYTPSNPPGFQGPVQPGQGGACPRGFHLNKHALPPSKRHGAVPARALCVRNRHMNPFNYRADGRALRRLKRADKRLRKIHNLFHRRAPRGVIGKKR